VNHIWSPAQLKRSVTKQRTAAVYGEAGQLAHPAIAAFLDWGMDLRDSQAAARQALAAAGRVE
jgi:hypothetical protein